MSKWRYLTKQTKRSLRRQRKTDTQPAEEETQSEENGEEPGEYTWAEKPNEEEPEDITDDILGDADTEGYDYEDPEE